MRTKIFTAKPLSYVETRIVPDISDRSEAEGALPMPIHCACQYIVLAKHSDYIISNTVHECVMHVIYNILQSD